MGLKNLAMVFLLVEALWASSSDGSVPEKSVAFLALAPYADTGGQADPGWKGGPAVIPAVRLAVDRINNRTDVLPGYEVQLLEGDSGCQNLPKSAFSFVSNVFNEAIGKSSPHVVGVIGPACSESALLLGTLGARDSISLIQISPSATSPLLTDTAKYPNTYRTLSTAFQHMEAVTKIMALNLWENVALLHDNTRVFFRTTTEIFLQKYSSAIGFHSEIDGNNYPLGSIEAKYKVIVVFAGSQLVQEVLCLAYHHKPQVLYPIYQWIFVDKTKDLFLESVQFVYNGRLYNCSREMMEQAVRGSIFTRYQIVHLSAEKRRQATDVDLTFEEYEELYASYVDEHIKQMNELRRDASYNADAKEFALSYYDATWALALALNASLDTISLSEYTRGRPEITEVIKQQLNQVRFEGIMGTIAFRSSTHDSSTSITIDQCIDGRSVVIASYNGTALEILSAEAKFVTDRFYRRVIGVHPAATTVSLVLVLIFAVYTLCLHALFIVFRNHKSIKAASFTLSHFMFSGCYLILLQALLTTVVFSTGWQTRSVAESRTRDIILSVSCNANKWLNNIGIALVMGTLCGKLWRIYRIFNHFNTKRWLISDQTLTVFVVAVVSVDTVLLTAWNAFDPLLAVFEQQGITYNEDSEPVLLERVFCRCTYLSLWIYLALSVGLLLGATVVILSSMNRRISRAHFRTAKSVNLMVYLIAFSCFMAVGLGYVFESLDVHYGYVSWQFSLLSIVCLVCVFVLSPPVLSAIKMQCL